MDCLAYRTARDHVRAFKSEGDEIVERSYEAEECGDCESYLQLGIDAFNWLQRASDHISRLISEGRIRPDERVDQAIEVLYRLWLPPVRIAEEWVSVQTNRGYQVENLENFRSCKRTVLAIIAEIDKMKAVAERVPPSDDLGLIATDASAWLGEPGWVQK